MLLRNGRLVDHMYSREMEILIPSRKFLTEGSWEAFRILLRIITLAISLLKQTIPNCLPNSPLHDL